MKKKIKDVIIGKEPCLYLAIDKVRITARLKDIHNVPINYSIH